MLLLKHIWVQSAHTDTRWCNLVWSTPRPPKGWGGGGGPFLKKKEGNKETGPSKGTGRAAGTRGGPVAVEGTDGLTGVEGDEAERLA